MASGISDQAMRMAKENVEEALALNHALSLANALVQAAMSHCLFHRGFGRSGAFRVHVTRSFDKACAGPLARLGTLL